MPSSSIHFNRRTERSESFDPKNKPVCDTILIVEDEILLRMMIADELRHVGYTVVEASNAVEALDILNHDLDVRLVLSDLEMPGAIGGIEFARLVQLEHPNTKIVLTSGQLAPADSCHDGFIPKPYDPTEVIRHIKVALMSQRDI